MRLTGMPCSGFFDGRVRILLRSPSGARYFSTSQTSRTACPSGVANSYSLP